MLNVHVRKCSVVFATTLSWYYNDIKEKFVGLLSKLPSMCRLHVRKHFGHPTTETPQGVIEVHKDKSVGKIFHAVMGGKYHQHHVTFEPTPPRLFFNFGYKCIAVTVNQHQCRSKTTKLTEAFQLKQKMPFNSPQPTAITNQIGKFIVIL